MVVSRFDIVLVNLDPTVGKEINKTRPAIIITPNNINQHWATVLIIPLTSTIRDLGFRVDIKFQNKEGQACVDQLRAIDKERIIRKLGTLDGRFREPIFWCCKEMFKK